MKFKIDENLPAELASDLSYSGHEAETVVDEGLTGASDPTLLAKVQNEGRVLFTMDKGVADVRAYPPELYRGIVLFRPRTQGRNTVLAFVRQHLPALLSSELAGHLLVVTESGIRIR